jgi:nicotinamidase-related amidase
LNLTPLVVSRLAASTLHHSRNGFYSTTLDLLLKHLGAQTLILAGFTADICILFTANDAYMRDYGLLIPSDCVASQDETENQRALKFMERVLKADIRRSSRIDLAATAQDRVHNLRCMS